MESPGAYVDEFNAAIFAWPCDLSDCPPTLVDYHLERGGMPLNDAVGVNGKRVQKLKIKSQGPIYGLRGVCV